MTMTLCCNCIDQCSTSTLRFPNQLALSTSFSICKLHDTRIRTKRGTTASPVCSTVKAPDRASSSSTASTSISSSTTTQTRRLNDGRGEEYEDELDYDGILLRSSEFCTQRNVSVSSSISAEAASLLWSWRHKISDLLSGSRFRSILLLNLLTFLYGSNIPIIKETEAISNPSQFLVGRFALAALAFSPFISNGMKNVEVRNASLELGLWISMAYATQGLSLLTCDAGRASFISAFTVIAVPLLAGLSGRKISKITWASAVTAFVGVGFLETSGSPATVGDLWSLVSALLFGVHMLRTEHYSRSLNKENLLPLLSMQLLVITLSSLLFCVGNMALQGSIPEVQGIDLNALWQSMQGMPWLPMTYTGVVSTALCLWIEMTAMRDVSATDTAVIYSLEPLWGAAFAWIFLGERWGSKGWVGALLILGGSLAVQLVQAQDGITKDVEKSRKL